LLACWVVFGFLILSWFVFLFWQKVAESSCFVSE
jgi:hypothetical protein